jgi:hypothetical protein
VQGSQGAPKSEGQAGGVPRPQSSSEPRPRGTVYLAWDSQRNLYWGYWDQLPDGPPRPLEQRPLSSDIRTVVQWGRTRARRVIIRPESDPAQYYGRASAIRKANSRNFRDFEVSRFANCRDLTS